MWFLHQLDPDTAAYHIAFTVRLHGALDRGALHRALGDVLARHESLRTLIRTVDGEPYSHVLTPGDARPGLAVVPVAETELEAALREAAAAPSTWRRTYRCGRPCSGPPRTGTTYW